MKKEKLSWGNLTYTDVGEGTTPLILLHNAGGNHQIMQSIAEYFQKNTRVISIDMRGHGESDTPSGDYLIEELADDVYKLCKILQLKGLAFVGLNYGANIGIALDQKFPGLISYLTLLEPPIFMEEWVIESVKEHIQDLKSIDQNIYAKKLVNEVLPNGTKKEKSLATAAFVKTPPTVQVSIYEQLIMWDTRAKTTLKVSNTKTLLIQAKKSFTKESLIKEYYTNLIVEKSNSVGPWIPLEDPNELNKLIKCYLDV
ncbi:MAG: Haloalkane dehalogenase [Chlamydiia bacterium]|nr:Haloalkane dehalogenase [Chlamydiia bacterium]